jgi:hypothetical protein
LPSILPLRFATLGSRIVTLTQIQKCNQFNSYHGYEMLERDV